MTKKVLLAGLVLAVVVGAVLLLVPTTTWLGLLLRPGHTFDATRLSPAPDYSKVESWVALPDRDDLSDLSPRGVTPVSGDQEADAFYIHPTTHYSSAEWNAPLDDERVREMRDLTIANQASIFNACCRVYAPTYRQATIGAYFDLDESNQAAFRIAYRDVAAAFRTYLDRYNQGRPFIIAGHSQGTQHALRLLAEMGAERERLVAAYLVGYGATTELLGAPPCTGARDTGCAVAWDTVAEGFESPDMPHYHWRGDRLAPTQTTRHCTNPISWSLDGEPASAERHLGSLFVELNHPIGDFGDLLLADGPLGFVVTGLSAPEPGTVSARCHRGWLEVPHQENPFRADFEAYAGTYHLFDFDLFYMDIRQNAVDRVAAFVENAAQRTGLVTR